MATVRFFIFLSLLSVASAAQSHKAFELTDSLHEASGMATDGTYVWFINDSGNAPLLFEYKGETYMGAYPIAARNRDWEALTMDREGNLFLCDIGNNRNDVPLRVIYKIDKSALNHSFKTLFPDTFSVYIPVGFPVSEAHRDYDWESCVYHSGHLHTFSKNRREHFDGEIVHFQLNHIYQKKDTAVARDTTHWGTLLRESYWITDATLSNDRRHLFLLTSNAVLAFLDFPEDRFFEGYQMIFPLGDLSQKEAITAWNDSTLLIADERHPLLGGGNVYTLYVKRELEEYEAMRRAEVHLDSKVIDSTLTIRVEPIVTTKVYVTLYADNGTVVKQVSLGEAPSNELSEFVVDVNELPVGHYVLNVACGRIPHGFFLKKPFVSKTENQSIDQDK
ncbi:MAG: hypothetical protein EP346_08200 [Bacteroidetes bacterium]|nr:MAG: hypothetical protein EP346_08200 [Bacteroidota bacterium]